MQSTDRLKLEGTEFQGNHRRRLRVEDHLGEGNAVVPASPAIEPGMRKDPGHQLGGGRLPVGSGDGDNTSTVVAGGQFHFADHFGRMF